jgi:hypothetical protein
MCAGVYGSGEDVEARQSRESELVQLMAWLQHQEGQVLRVFTRMMTLLDWEAARWVAVVIALRGCQVGGCSDCCVARWVAVVIAVLPGGWL